MLSTLAIVALSLTFAPLSGQAPENNARVTDGGETRLLEKTDYSEELPESFMCGGAIVSVSDFEKDYLPEDFEGFSAKSARSILKTDTLCLWALETEPIGKAEYLRIEDLLLRRDDVLSVEPDQYGAWFTTLPNDYISTSDWYIPKVSLDKAWSISKGSANVKVGVIDTGIKNSLTDLSGKCDTNLGYSWSPNSSDPHNPGHFHGTAVASVLGANTDNNHALPGAGWNCQLVSLRVDGEAGGFIDEFGIPQDEYQEKLSYVISAIAYAQNASLPILNFSGGFFNTTIYLEEAIEAYSGLLVCAAGNAASLLQDIDSNPIYPASYALNNVLAVGASDQTDSRCDFSCYGSSSVDLFAPGTGIRYQPLNNDNPDPSLTFPGTSVASPIVAGVAALIKSVNPSLTAAQIKSAIINNVDPVPALSGYCVTGGRLNAQKALESLYSNLMALPSGGSVQATIPVPGANAFFPSPFEYVTRVSARAGEFDFESVGSVAASVGTLYDSSWDVVAFDALGSGEGSNFKFTHAFSASGTYWLRAAGFASAGVTSLTLRVTNHHSHSYDDSYTHVNGYQHVAYCSCGEYVMQGHVVTPFDTHTCVLCGGYAAVGLVIPSGSPSSPQGASEPWVPICFDSRLYESGNILLGPTDWGRITEGSLTYRDLYAYGTI